MGQKAAGEILRLLRLRRQTPARPTEKRKSPSKRDCGMKALSVKQPWANLIARGDKTVEMRSRPTKYRGPILIVSSRSPRIELAGYALAIVDVVDCRIMTERDESGACCPSDKGKYAWILANIRPLSCPFPVRGQLGIYEVEMPRTRSLI